LREKDEVDDFNPIKEKTEEEYQIGSDKFAFFRKKKTLEGK